MCILEHPFNESLMPCHTLQIDLYSMTLVKDRISVPGRCVGGGWGCHDSTSKECLVSNFKTKSFVQCHTLFLLMYS